LVADAFSVDTSRSLELENRELRAKNDVLERQLKVALRENGLLRERLEELLRARYGPKAERIDPNQLQMPFADLIDVVLQECEAEMPPQGGGVPDDETAPPAPRKRGAHGRKPLPKDIPRVRIEHHPAEKTCAGCQRELQRIGEEVTEELDWQPASFSVTEHVRPKYACRHCQEGVIIAELPPRPIEKGRPGPGLLANVLVSKYADHLPLHRLEGIFGRYGIELSRSTMCDWVRDCAELFTPIVKEQKRSVLESGVLHVDDTGVLCLENSTSGKKRPAHLWAWVGERGEVVYDFTLTKEEHEPKRFIGAWEGYLQCDAGTSFHAILASPKVIEVGCWAHARRRFLDALPSDTARASKMLGLVQVLYKIEAQAQESGLDPPSRAKLRQQEAKPILARIGEEIEHAGRDVLPRSSLGEAIGYVRNQWQALNRYVEDGRLAIDNNTAERALRTVAVGRSNWLFTGSPAGGERAATIYSLIATCKLLRIEPFAYLRDVFNCMLTHPASELTPRAWKAAHAPR